MNFLVFDLDGTISDPTEGIAAGINVSLQERGYPSVSEEEVMPFIGPPLDYAFKKLTGTIDATEIASLIISYRAYYGTAGLKQNVLCPEITEIIVDLHTANLNLGICTSKREDFASSILDHFSLRHYFKFVSGGDVGITKSGQLKELVSRGTIGGGSIMIGDRDVDILAARDNGLRSCAVTWGHATGGELEHVNPDFIVRSPEELVVLANVV